MSVVDVIGGVFVVIILLLLLVVVLIQQTANAPVITIAEKQLRKSQHSNANFNPYRCIDIKSNIRNDNKKRRK